MNKQVGAVSWTVSTQTRFQKEEAKKIPFVDMRTYNKTYRYRIVDAQPMLYHCHWIVDHAGEKAKVNCTLNRDCPVVDEKTKSPCAGNYPQGHYYAKVLDRADGTIRVLDFGPQIYNQIAELHANEDWGDCTQYDISIKKGPKGASPLYTVSPSPKKPLTAEEKALVAAANDPENEAYIDLESRCKPGTADFIKYLLTGVTSEKKSDGASKTEDKPKKALAGRTAPAESADVESDDVIEWGDEDVSQ